MGTPKASIASYDTVCVGSTVLFTGTSTPSGLAYSHRWLFSDNGALGYAASVNHVFASPGDFQVRYIASTYPGCADTVYKMIHVKPGPVVDFTADKVIGCDVPFAVQFTSITTPATGPVSYTHLDVYKRQLQRRI